MEEIGDELVTKLSIWKNEDEIDDLPWGMLEREKRWIERRSYSIREKASLLRIWDVIDYSLYRCTYGQTSKAGDHLPLATCQAYLDTSPDLP